MHHEFMRKKKQNGVWKLSDTDWFYFPFIIWFVFFFDDPSWFESNFILLLFFYSIRVGPSRSELTRPGLAVWVDPVRLWYLPLLAGRWNALTVVQSNGPNVQRKIKLI